MRVAMNCCRRQHLFFLYTVTLFSHLAASVYGLVDQLDKPEEQPEYKKCYEVEAEKMIKYLYVHGDKQDDIELKCPVENKKFDWKADYQSSGKYFRYIYLHRDPLYYYYTNTYYATGDSLKTYALNIGKPEQSSSGVYCCKMSDYSRFIFSVVVTHAVLILSKEPEIKLTPAKQNPVNVGDEVSLQCSKPKSEEQLSYTGFNGTGITIFNGTGIFGRERIKKVALKPTIVWEKSSELLHGAHGITYEFRVTPAFLNVPFRCGWRYENLFNNGTSKTFYSNSILPVYLYIDKQLSTKNRIKVIQGSSTVLTCAFKANPPVNHTDLIWTKMSIPERQNLDELQEVLIDDIKNTSDTGKKFMQKVTQQDYFTTFYSLKINNFSKEDIASYRCKLSNQLEREFKVNEQQRASSSTGRFLSLGFIVLPFLLNAILLP